MNNIDYKKKYVKYKNKYQELQKINNQKGGGTVMYKKVTVQNPQFQESRIFNPYSRLNHDGSLNYYLYNDMIKKNGSFESDKLFFEKTGAERGRAFIRNGARMCEIMEPYPEIFRNINNNIGLFKNRYTLLGKQTKTGIEFFAVGNNFVIRDGGSSGYTSEIKASNIELQKRRSIASNFQHSGDMKKAVDNSINITNLCQENEYFTEAQRRVDNMVSYIDQLKPLEAKAYSEKDTLYSGKY